MTKNVLTMYDVCVWVGVHMYVFSDDVPLSQTVDKSLQPKHAVVKYYHCITTVKHRLFYP